MPPFQAQVQARPRRHQAQAGFQKEMMLEEMRPEAMESTEATEEVAEIEAKKGAGTARSSQCCRVLPPLPPMQLGAVMPSPAHGVDTYGSCLVFSFFCLEHPFSCMGIERNRNGVSY